MVPPAHESPGCTRGHDLRARGGAPLRPMSRRSPRSRRGASSLEFALVLPVFLALLAGLLDYGWYLFQQAGLDAATQAGCRAGALVDPGEADMDLGAALAVAEGEIARALAAGGSPCGGDCTYDITTEGAAPARSLRCTTRRSVAPLLGLSVRARSLEARSLARFERQR